MEVGLRLKRLVPLKSSNALVKRCLLIKISLRLLLSPCPLLLRKATVHGVTTCQIMQGKSQLTSAACYRSLVPRMMVSISSKGGLCKYSTSMMLGMSSVMVPLLSSRSLSCKTKWRVLNCKNLWCLYSKQFTRCLQKPNSSSTTWVLLRRKVKVKTTKLLASKFKNDTNGLNWWRHYYYKMKR